MRLAAEVIRRDPRDDRVEPRIRVTFQQGRAFPRRAENGEVVAEFFFGLLEKTFHPLPAFSSSAVAIGLNIESRIERGHGTFSHPAVRLGILIDLVPRGGESLQRWRQGDPAVSQTRDALKPVLVPVGGDPDGYSQLLRRVRQD